MSYATVEEVALFLNREVTDFSALELAQINFLLPYIDGVINNYCGWNMLDTEYTDKRFDGSGTDSLDLRLSPVSSLIQARVRAADGTFTDATDGIELLDDGVIKFLPYATTEITTFTAGSKNWFISFTAGYDSSNIPYELSYASCCLVALHFNKIIDENLGEQEEKFGEVTFKNESLAIPKPVARLLDRFRLVSIF